MFKNIIVPIDLSGRNTRALAAAVTLAEQSHARVTLLHVIHRVPHLSPRELAGFYRRLTATARRRVDQAARPFATRGVAVRTQVLIGEPAGEIVAAAGRLRADLILMGSHRVGVGRPGRGWGTTSYKVGLLCRCAVLLVK